MKKTFALLIFSFCITISFAQKQIVKSQILSKTEIEKIFTRPVKKEFKLQYPIFRVYKYTDRSGEYFTVLTESSDSLHVYKTIKRTDSISYKIKAVTLKNVHGKLSQYWELSDLANRSKKGEQAIWFWTKYSEFKDFNNDFFADLIIVYGTTGYTNGNEDGRINIIIYQNKQKVVLTNNNGSALNERRLEIDKKFYSLPVKIQNAVKEKMELMSDNHDARFPSEWQKEMQGKKNTIIEKPSL